MLDAKTSGRALERVTDDKNALMSRAYDITVRQFFAEKNLKTATKLPLIYFSLDQ